MLYHQVIEIGSYVLFLNEKPVEPKAARLVLTGTEDKLVAVGFNVDFRLRDLKAHISNILKRSIAISEEMVEWFFETLPITRTISTSFNLNKDIFKNLEDKYYECETIDQFLRVKIDSNAVVGPLLNLDFYELVGLEIVSDEDSEDLFSNSYLAGDNIEESDSMFAYFGVISRLILVQITAALRAALIELFSARR
ncbi:MAG: hypothetical protein KatS3mg068_0249 [Candidatus Sericytochromatia bacterium]|nr:MAG: hypothetical protein KatS3mg068_0249 [Candidatus Sericytochromatia bacterium]